MGRISKQINVGGSYTNFTEYFAGTNFARFQKDYTAANALIVTREYNSSGALISTTYPEPSTTPVLIQTVLGKDYTYVSGSVDTTAAGGLNVFSNRSITYALSTAQTGPHSLTLYTDQVDGANAPAGYKFRLKISVDGVLITTIDAPAQKGVFQPTDSIDLGSLSAGSHTLTIEWTNDYYSPHTYDANLGIKSIELYKVGSVVNLPCDGSSCIYDSQGRPTRSNYADGTYALNEYYTTTNQKSKSTFYTSLNALIKTLQFYQSGNEKSLRNANGSGHDRLDENFLGPFMGRISKQINV